MLNYLNSTPKASNTEPRSPSWLHLMAFLGSSFSHLGAKIAILAPLGAPFGDLGRLVGLKMLPSGSQSLSWSSSCYFRRHHGSKYSRSTSQRLVKHPSCLNNYLADNSNNSLHYESRGAGGREAPAETGRKFCTTCYDLSRKL